MPCLFGTDAFSAGRGRARIVGIRIASAGGGNELGSVCERFLLLLLLLPPGFSERCVDAMKQPLL